MPITFPDIDLDLNVVERLRLCAIDMGVNANNAKQYPPTRPVQTEETPFVYHYFGATFTPWVGIAPNTLTVARTYIQRWLFKPMGEGEDMDAGSEIFATASPWLTKIHIFYNWTNSLSTSEEDALRYCRGIGLTEGEPPISDTGLIRVLDSSGQAWAGVNVSIPVIMRMNILAT